MIITTFTLRGITYAVLDNGCIYIIDTKGSNYPSDWTFMSVCSLFHG